MLLSLTYVPHTRTHVRMYHALLTFDRANRGAEESRWSPHKLKATVRVCWRSRLNGPMLQSIAKFAKPRYSGVLSEWVKSLCQDVVRA